MIDGPQKLCRVGVLLKLHYLLPTEGKEVGELRSDMLPGLFIDAAVITVPDDGIASVQDFFGRDHEPLPFIADPHEDAFQHGARPDIRIPIGVDEILGFPEVLRNVAQAHGNFAGVYCAVLVEGLLKKGDLIELAAN